MQDNYEEIVRKWYNKLGPLFRNTLHSKYENLSFDTIEDLYQDAFIAVHENLLRGRIKENTSWSSYIIQIGLNLASKDMRHSGITDSIDNSPICDEDGQSALSREVERLLAVNVESDKSIYTDYEAQQVLGTELNYTPEPCATIIRLYYYDRMSMEDIAVAVNMKNATTAKSKKSQCMKTLVGRVKDSLKKCGIID